MGIEGEHVPGGHFSEAERKPEMGGFKEYHDREGGDYKTEWAYCVAVAFAAG